MAGGLSTSDPVAAIDARVGLQRVPVGEDAGEQLRRHQGRTLGAEEQHQVGVPAVQSAVLGQRHQRKLLVVEHSFATFYPTAS